MATTSLWPIKKTINNTIEYVENKDKTQIHISDLSSTIDYASNKNKTEEQFYVTGINCDSNNVFCLSTDIGIFSNCECEIMIFKDFMDINLLRKEK